MGEGRRRGERGVEVLRSRRRRQGWKEWEEREEEGDGVVEYTGI
jgi:hypothetical protein